MVDAAGRLEGILSETDVLHAVATMLWTDRALAQADAGKLTTCERCGGDIPLARLRAMPGATTCIACARTLEV